MLAFPNNNCTLIPQEITKEHKGNNQGYF